MRRKEEERGRKKEKKRMNRTIKEKIFSLGCDVSGVGRKSKPTLSKR